MDGIEKWRCAFNALVSLQITAGEEILHAAETRCRRLCWRFRWQRRICTRAIGAEGAAIFEAELNPFAAAEVVIDAAGIVEDVLARRKVDNAGGAQPIFGRQRASHQRQAADKIGIQNAAETADAVWQKNAVDTILRVGMIVANVEQTARS